MGTKGWGCRLGADGESVGQWGLLVQQGEQSDGRACVCVCLCLREDAPQSARRQNGELGDQCRKSKENKKRKKRSHVIKETTTTSRDS